MGSKYDDEGPLTVRISAEQRRALDQAAEAHDRSRSQQARRYLREGLERDGLLPKAKG